MTMSAAGRTFFFDIVNFLAGRNLAVTADDASAAESGETEKPDETHRALHSRAQQYTCRTPRRSVLNVNGYAAPYSDSVRRHRTQRPHSEIGLGDRTRARY